MTDVKNPETAAAATVASTDTILDVPTAKRQKKNTEKMAVTAWKVFPPKSHENSQPPFALTVGDTVFVRSKSSTEKGRRGRIVQLEQTEEDAKDRCQIEWEQQPKDSEPKQSVSVARKRLLPVDANSFLSKPEFTTLPAVVQVIVTATTQKFRLLAQSHTESTDHVLELGCSSGETSIALWKYCKSWVGLDTSSNMISKVNERLSVLNKNSKKQSQTTASCACFQLNALADPAGAVEHACLYSGPTGPTVIYLDIGGNREEAGVIRMMQWILQSFSSVLTVVIKSQEVHKAIVDQSGVDDGTGEFVGGHEWFQDRLRTAVTLSLPHHPLQASKMLSPVDGTTPICRYHNYFKDGCAKGEALCPFDHDHCHLCLQKGHIATQCPSLLQS
jgi:SAM-dependent methyltransferase